MSMLADDDIKFYTYLLMSMLADEDIKFYTYLLMSMLADEDKVLHLPTNVHVS